MSRLEDEKFVSSLLKDSLNRIEKLESQLYISNEPIAIIGIGCRFPGGANNPESYWDLLAKGKEAVGEVPPERWDADAYYHSDPSTPGKSITKTASFLNIDVTQFDSAYFNISPLEAETMDPQQRLVLEVTVEALENAGIASNSLAGSKTGVFLGIYSHDLGDLLSANMNRQWGIFTGTGCSSSIASGRVSYFFDLKGPNLAIDTACSASLVALDNACHFLHSGEINLAIVGGVNIMLSPIPFVGMTKASMLAPDGRCKTFDSRADGFGRGEGCGVVILKRLSDAKKDNDKILALIRAVGVNQDGASNGLTAPNGIAQKELIQEVCQKADVKYDRIEYIETHGTGTSLGDPIEVKAIGETYGQRSIENPLKMGSVKTNIGHTESAAGIAGLIKIVLMLNYEQIPPLVGFKKLNPNIKLNFPAEIVTENLPWKRGKQTRLAAINSFGFSGTNAHAIIEEAPVIAQIPQFEDRPLHLLTLSAKTEPALNELIQNYLTFLDHTDSQLGDICYTAHTGRNHERYRLAVVAKDLTELKMKLAQGDFVKGKTKEVKPYDFTSKDLNELALAYTKGASVDWKKFDAPYPRRKVSLPTYPFQRKRYWVNDAKPLPGPIQSNEVSLTDEISILKIIRQIKESPKDNIQRHISSYIDQLIFEIAKIPIGTAKFDIPLNEYGFDSIMLGKIANQLVRDFGINVNIADIQQLQTLDELSLLIQQRCTEEKSEFQQDHYDSRDWKVIKQPEKIDLRLFVCAPFGFGESSFHSWVRHLPENIELHFVGFHFEENWEKTITRLAEKIDALSDKPFLIYGHSMGGIVAYELSVALQEKFNLIPQKLIISSVATPKNFSKLKQIIPFNRYLEDDPIEQWIDLLKKEKFLPPDSMHLKIISPDDLKGDIKAVLHYHRNKIHPINCPLLVFHANQDVLLPDEKVIVEWKSYTSMDFSYIKIDGTHLFFMSPPKKFFEKFI